MYPEATLRAGPTNHHNASTNPTSKPKQPNIIRLEWGFACSFIDLPSSGIGHSDECPSY
jgi:hypothetical protein